MAQNPKKKDPKLSKDILEKPDHDVMEELFGKRVVRELDKLTGRDPEAPKDGEK